MLIPLRLGLLGPDGAELPLRLRGSGQDLGTETVLRVTEAEQEFVFEGVEVRGMGLFDPHELPGQPVRGLSCGQGSSGGMQGPEVESLHGIAGGVGARRLRYHLRAACFPC